MTPESWQRIKVIFEASLDLPPAERGAFLDTACAGDRSLRAEVESLLAAGDTQTALLRTPTSPIVDLPETVRLARSRSDTKARLVASLGGRYKLGVLLGQGGMGVVYKATDNTLERPVAIKVLAPELAVDAKLISRFEREARIAAGLDHPGIIPVYAVEKGDGIYYIVMKYIQGQGLDEVIRSGPSAIAYCQRILWECASALGHAHQRGIVHRDIKPANIMVDDAGRVVITDFGISKATQATTQLTATGQIVGTPYYMSPEQAMGLDMDGRGDQYSLAMAGYHLLTGQLPFGELPLHTVLYKQIFEAPTPIRELRPDAPAFLVNALEKALAKEPENRFSTMESFARAVLPDRPESAAGDTTQLAWGSVVRRAHVRRRFGIIAGGSVVAAAVVAGTIWLSNRKIASDVTDTTNAGPGPVASVALPDTTTAGTTPKDSTTITTGPPPEPRGADTGVTRPSPDRTTRTRPGESSRSSTRRPDAVTRGPVVPATPAFGYLTIDSRPYGTVFVDGVEIGDTPLVNHSLTPGRHVVEVRREGYQTATDTVDVVAGNLIRRNKTLIER